jgi:hypothetical protein
MSMPRPRPRPWPPSRRALRGPNRWKGWNRRSMSAGGMTGPAAATDKTALQPQAMRPRAAGDKPSRVGDLQDGPAVRPAEAGQILSAGTRTGRSVPDAKPVPDRTQRQIIGARERRSGLGRTSVTGQAVTWCDGLGRLTVGFLVICSGPRLAQLRGLSPYPGGARWASFSLVLADSPYTPVSE